MNTVDRDKSTMMALHELRAIEQRRIAAEAAAEQARRGAERYWTWGFAAVSWLGAFTLIAILWHVAQRPPVVPRFVVPDIDPALFGLPGAGRAAPPATPGPTTAAKDRAEGGPADAPRNASVSAQAGPRRGSPPLHPRGAARNDTRSVPTKTSLEACAHSDDPLACVNLDDQPLGREPRPKPKTR